MANPSQHAKKALMFILFLNIIMSFSNYFVFDFPQALEEPLIRRLHITTVDIGFLYAIYALPNILFSPMSGYFMEKAGLVVSSLSFTGLVFLGHLVVTIGIYFRNYPIVVLGRGLYGIGGEGLVILQPTVNEFWFSGSMLSLSNGLCQSINFAGIMLGNYLVPKYFSSTRNIMIPFYVSFGVCVFSCIGCIVYILAHQRFEHFKATTEQEKEDDKMITSAANEDLASSQKEISFGFSAIKTLSLKFWLCGLVFFLLANSFFQFTNIATDLVVNRYGYSFEEAKSLTVIPSFTIILSAPAISHYLQTQGKKGIALLIAAVAYLLVYSIMYNLPPRRQYMLNALLVVIGLSHSVLLSTIYTCVGLSVPRQGVGMAYGLIAFIENFGLTIFPLLLSSISTQRSVEAYNQCILSLALISLGSVLVCTALAVEDLLTNRLLDYPENCLEVAKVRMQIEKAFVTSRLHIGGLKEPMLEMKEMKEIVLPPTAMCTPEDDKPRKFEIDCK